MLIRKNIILYSGNSQLLIDVYLYTGVTTLTLIPLSPSGDDITPASSSSSLSSPAGSAAVAAAGGDSAIYQQQTALRSTKKSSLVTILSERTLKLLR